MARFIMIDLETLGAEPGCSIVAIGAAAATADGFVTDRFYTIVSRADCALAGLHENPETLDWWGKQSEDARQVLALSEQPDAASLRDALSALNAFVARHPHCEVYGNGSDFDNAILAAAAYRVAINLAWPFWRNRCYRTLKARAPGVQLRRTGVHHHALDDAVTQAEHLGRINQHLTLTSDQIVAANAFLTFMADRYRERTARRLLGFRWHTLDRSTAMQFALATFDCASDDVPFGDSSHAWDRDHAHELVDSDLQHWEAN